MASEMFRFRHVEVKNGEPVAAFESDNFVSFMNLTKLISSFTKKEDEETIQEYRLAICGIIKYIIPKGASNMQPLFRLLTKGLFSHSVQKEKHGL